MTTSICYCGGELFASFWLPHRQAICVNKYEVQTEHGNISLKRTKQHSLYLPLESNVTETLSCTLYQSFSFAHGEYNPYLIITFKEDGKFLLAVHKVDASGLSQIIYEVLTPDLTANQTWSLNCENIHLADGPLVVVAKETYLLVASESDLKMKLVATPAGIPINKVFYAHSFYPFMINSQPCHVWLLAMKHKISNSLFLGFLVFDHRKKHYWEQISSIPSGLFLYQAYDSIVTSIKINFMSAPHWSDSIFSTSLEDHLGDHTWLRNNMTLVATHRMQFLVFVGGSLKYCCPILFSDVTGIQQYLSSKEITFGLQSSTKGVTILKKTQDSLSVFHSCEEALCLFKVDDNKNIPQMLLLFDLPSEDDSLLTSCTLVKLSASDAAVEGSFHMNLNENKALETTREGLHQRLIAGQTALLELEHRVKKKHALIEHVFENLNAANSGGPTSVTKQADVVTVVPGLESLLSETRHQQNSCRTESFLEVDDDWLARWDQILIFGKTVRNKGMLPVSNIRELLVIDKVSELSQSCKVFGSWESELSTKPFCLTSVLEPSASCTVVVTMGIPMCPNSDLSITSILFWHTQSESNLEMDVLNLEHKVLRQSVSKFSIPVISILKNEVKTVFELPIYQQIMSLRSRQSSEFLSVRSRNLDISDFETIVTENKQDPQIRKIANNLKILLFSDRSGPLCGVNVSILAVGRSQVDLMSYTRNDQEFNLLLHWLYSALPDEIFILPDVGEKPCQQLLQSISDEIEFIHSTLSGLCCADEGQQAGTSKQDTVQGSSIEKVHGKGQMFQCSLTEYRKLRNTLSSKETVTDICAVKIFGMHTFTQ